MILPKLIEELISYIAGGLIIAAQLLLIWDVIKRKISPGLLSWLGWGLLMGTSLVSQIVDKGWQWNQMGLLCSAVGCICIFSIAWIYKNYLMKKSDWSFLFLGLICMIIYLISKDPWLTTGFAILADFIVGIPTLRHAYSNPASQKTSAWTLGFISWIFSLILCIGHSWLFAMFPIYLFIYNGAKIALTREKVASS